MTNLSKIVVPASSPLNLDTSTHIHATDDAGNKIVGDDGKPVHIAQDLTSGKWYAKVGDSMPHRDKAAMKEAADAGAVHVVHANGRYRGLWVPIPENKNKKAN